MACIYYVILVNLLPRGESKLGSIHMARKYFMIIQFIIIISGKMGTKEKFPEYLKFRNTLRLIF